MYSVETGVLDVCRRCRRLSAGVGTCDSPGCHGHFPIATRLFYVLPTVPVAMITARAGDSLTTLPTLLDAQQYPQPMQPCRSYFQVFSDLYWEREAGSQLCTFNTSRGECKKAAPMCFYCNQSSHWKRNCFTLQAKRIQDRDVVVVIASGQLQLPTCERQCRGRCHHAIIEGKDPFDLLVNASTGNALLSRRHQGIQLFTQHLTAWHQHCSYEPIPQYS